MPPESKAVTPGGSPPKPRIAPQKSRKHALARFNALKADRDPFDSHLEEIRQHLMPRRGRAPGMTGQDRTNGQRKGTRIVNGTPLRALRVCASGMTAGTTSPARPWFALSVADPALKDRADVRRWLDDLAEQMRDILARSNFYSVMPPVYAELAAFGTASFIMLEDSESVVRFEAFTWGEYWIALDERGRVDTFVRRPVMTVGQVVARYGEDKVSKPVSEKFKQGKVDEPVELMHIIQRNEEYIAGWKDYRGFPYRETVFEAADHGKGEDADPLSDRGFREFPVLVPRWETLGTCPYGTNSPGMESLGDCKQLQFTETKSAELLDKGNTPPLQAPPGLQGKAIGLFPGAITYRPPVQGMDSKVEVIYQPDHNWYTATERKIQMLESRIERFLYVDLFQMLGSLEGVQPRNQMELADRREEKMLQLGTPLERLNDDTFDPLIDRLFAIMWRRGMVAPPPRVLEDRPLKVEYTSILHQAQKAAATGQIERFAGFVAQLATVFPQALDKVNVDQAIDDYGRASGTPGRLIHSDEEVAAIREGRAQQQQMAQMAAMAPALKQGAEGLATAATTTPTADNMLGRLSEAMG
jgi:hypothetical protein